MIEPTDEESEFIKSFRWTERIENVHAIIDYGEGREQFGASVTWFRFDNGEPRWFIVHPFRSDNSWPFLKGQISIIFTGTFAQACNHVAQAAYQTMIEEREKFRPLYEAFTRPALVGNDLVDHSVLEHIELHHPDAISPADLPTYKHHPQTPNETPATGD